MKDYRAKLETGKFYHIFNHAVGNRLLFQKDENYKFFLKKFEKYISPVASVYAYCLIPNHFHILSRINEIYPNGSPITNPSKHFKDLFSSYTQAFNRFMGTRGSLFEPRFKRRIITSETDLLNTLLYIHLNPLKHNLTKKLFEWDYSSFNIILNNEESFINREAVIQMFDDPENFIFVHEKRARAKNYYTGVSDMET